METSSSLQSVNYRKRLSKRGIKILKVVEKKQEKEVTHLFISCRTEFVKTERKLLLEAEVIVLKATESIICIPKEIYLKN